MTTGHPINPFEPPAAIRDSADVALHQHDPLARTSSSMSLGTRILLVFAGIVVPLYCHGLSLMGPPDPPRWQTGDLNDKLVFILSPQAGFVFYPMLLYAMLCLAAFLRFQRRGHIPFWVRLGVTGGVPIALFYTIILDLVVLSQEPDLGSVIMLLAAQFGIPLIAFGLVGLYQRKHRPAFAIAWRVLLSLVLMCPLAALFFVSPEEVSQVVISLPFVGSLFAGPAWALCVYGFVTWWIVKNQSVDPERRGSEFAASIAYWGLVLGACPAAIMLSLRRYGTLPVTPVGDCYVVTAAGRGHAWFVDARQLIVLKTFELVIQSNFPSIHRWLREVYDIVGPRLARRISNPWVADLAYVSLKPLEWLILMSLVIASFVKSRRHPAIGRDSEPTRIVDTKSP